MARFILLLVLPLILLSGPVSAQRLAGALSDRQVQVDSSFVGQILTLFGNVEPDLGQSGSPVEGPFQVIVVITGPAQDRVVRQQTNRFLIWLNTENETFIGIPSYKWVFSSAPLQTITSEDVLTENRIPLAATGDAVQTHGNGDAQVFLSQLVRLMTEKQLYGINETGVVFQSPTLYSVRIELPGDVPNGTFLAETYLFRSSALIAHKAESFVVRKTGLERLLGDSARDYPLAYGLVCVALALMTGWLGGVVFRR